MRRDPSERRLKPGLTVKIDASSGLALLWLALSVYVAVPPKESSNCQSRAAAGLANSAMQADNAAANGCCRCNAGFTQRGRILFSVTAIVTIVIIRTGGWRGFIQQHTHHFTRLDMAERFAHRFLRGFFGLS